MAEVTKSIVQPEGLRSSETLAPSWKRFSIEQIAAYKEGAERVGSNLLSVVEKIREAGKKPTILIPSRGAVPIFLLAMDFLEKNDVSETFHGGLKVRYYPRGVFEYLSNGDIKESKDQETESDIDIVLYPFTADVLTTTQDDRSFAGKIRRANVRAFLDLIKGSKHSPELQWHTFIMSKLKDKVFSTFHSSPEHITKSLLSLPSQNDREIVLIDTVISGQAVSNILESFSDEGNPVTPIMAVDIKQDDNGNEGKEKTDRMHGDYKGKIVNKMKYDYVESTESQFIRFPLISEDQGASLLGVTALNFSNFSEEIQTDGRNGETERFFPASCVWAIPPRDYYIPLFHQFIQICSSLDQLDRGDPIAIRDLLAYFEQVGKLISFRASEEDVSLAREVSDDLIYTVPKSVRETGSHIISVWLENEEKEQWLREFGEKVAASGGKK